MRQGGINGVIQQVGQTLKQGTYTFKQIIGKGATAVRGSQAFHAVIGICTHSPFDPLSNLICA